MHVMALAFVRGSKSHGQMRREQKALLRIQSISLHMLTARVCGALSVQLYCHMVAFLIMTETVSCNSMSESREVGHRNNLALKLLGAVCRS